MSISYSLVIRETPALLAVDSEGYLVDDPNAQWLAGAKGFVPRTWWSLFEFAELRLAQEHSGALVTTTEAALLRLRSVGPAWRVAGGHHVLPLRRWEDALARSPGRYLHAEMYEHCFVDDSDFKPPAATRYQADTYRGGSIGDQLLGVCRAWEGALPEDCALPSRIEQALSENDAADVDLLEAALIRRLSPRVADWLPICRARWAAGAADGAAMQVLGSLAAGAPAPFAALDNVAPGVAAHALHHAARSLRETPEGRRLRKSLGPIVRHLLAPLAAPILDAWGMRGISADAQALAEWLDGGALPHVSWAHPAAIMVWRLGAIGTAEPLCAHDPAAVLETGRFDGDAGDAELAIVRALRVPRVVVDGWWRGSDSPGAEPGNESAIRAFVGHQPPVEAALWHAVEQVTPDGRARLLALPIHDDTYWSGHERDSLRLAFGDASVLPALLDRFATQGARIPVHALRLGRVAARALPYLEALMSEASTDGLEAAALVLGAATSDAQRASAHGHALRAVQVAELACDAFDNGECNAAELIVALRCLRRIADALGEAGAPVRAVLERTASYRLARGLADAPPASF